MPPEKTPNCPNCGSSAVIPIMYGDPSPEAWAAAERGELSIGGCIVENGMPKWFCTNCYHEFGEIKLDDNLEGEDLDSILPSDL